MDVIQKCLLCGAILNHGYCPDIGCRRANPKDVRIAQLEAELKEARCDVDAAREAAQRADRAELLDVICERNEAQDRAAEAERERDAVHLADASMAERRYFHENMGVCRVLDPEWKLKGLSPIGLAREAAETIRSLREEIERLRLVVIDLTGDNDAAADANAKLRQRVEELEEALLSLLSRVDEMPNPHKDPMRHYFNQMQVWKDDARAVMGEKGEG
jgi:hypothetical protein